MTSSRRCGAPGRAHPWCRTGGRRFTARSRPGVSGNRREAPLPAFLDHIVLKHTWAREVRNVSLPAPLSIDGEGYLQIQGIVEEAKRCPPEPAQTTRHAGCPVDHLRCLHGASRERDRVRPQDARAVLREIISNRSHPAHSPEQRDAGIWCLSGAPLLPHGGQARQRVSFCKFKRPQPVPDNWNVAARDGIHEPRAP